MGGPLRDERLRALSVWTLLALASGATPLLGADDSTPDIDRVPDEEAAPAFDRSQLRRHEYSGLWPLYSRETYEDGRVATSSLFHLIRHESAPDGGSYHRFWPFYGARSDRDGSETGLAIYPLLYFRERTRSGGHDVQFPFFAHWYGESRSNTLLWPIFHVARNPAPLPFRAVPVLWRQERDDDTPTAALHWQAGYFLAFDLLAGRAAEGDTSVGLLGLFPITARPFPLRVAFWQRRIVENGTDWHAHVFPLFAAGASPSEDYFYSLPGGYWREPDDRWGLTFPLLLSWWSERPDAHDLNLLWPLVHHGESPVEREFRVLPFYWYDEDLETRERFRFWSLLYGTFERPILGEPDAPADAAAQPSGSSDRTRVDHYVPLLLGRYGYERPDSGTRDADLLFPLLHWSKRGDLESASRVLPFWDRSVDATGSSLGVGLFLYRHHTRVATGLDSHWVLFPCIHWARDDAGSIGWVLPVWASRKVIEPKKRDSWDLVLPVYFSRHVERRESPEDEWTATRETFHVWPFYGYYRRSPLDGSSRREDHYSLWPLIRLVEEEGDDVRGVQQTVHAPWPIIRHRTDDAGWDFRAYPLVGFGAEAERRSHLWVFPLLSLNEGPEARDTVWNRFSLVQHLSTGDSGHFRLLSLFYARWTMSDTSVTGPLWWFVYSDHADGGWFHLLPLGFGSWSSDDLELGVFPLWYRREHGARPIDYWNPVRLFFLVNTLESAQESHLSILWKLCEFTEGAEGGHDFRLLHRLVVHRDIEQQSEFVLNPFVSWSEDARTGDSTFSILHFLYRNEVRGGKRTVRVLFIPVAGDE